MNQNHKEIKKILNKVIGQKVTIIELGIGSFLNIDFGTLTTIKWRGNNNKEYTYTYGEWRLWVYMCAWRIDKDNRPFIASSDPREKIAQKIQEIGGTTLTKYEILNDSLDTKFYFNQSITITLFNCATDIDEDEKQWILFTPDKKTLDIGPADTWSYEFESHDLEDLKCLWMEFDPLGVYQSDSDWPDDEYDVYVVSTLELLKQGAPFDTLKSYISHVVHHDMGLEDIDDSCLDDFARKLLSVSPSIRNKS